MKELVVMSVLGVALYHFYGASLFGASAATEFNSYQQVLEKLRERTVTLEEAKHGVDLLALHLCNDEGYQTSGGSSTAECNDNYVRIKAQCLSSVFEDAPAQFSQKADVVELARAYIACAGLD
ncbi:hypothetical protein [Shewanella sedimentimangrovi]|uniref:Secreted protein n=1 Tax=Shewanella sedimentimangrovi TaxID=2814293 RepID=A0ABX7R354_9GAMM|nr:hypothetical protein [Shewanella sedimentimangrovi]QSX37615.1 hypothetical protein JYB85_01905 [Shewanella sedimentimangrovi]